MICQASQKGLNKVCKSGGVAVCAVCRQRRGGARYQTRRGQVPEGQNMACDESAGKSAEEQHDSQQDQQNDL